MQETFGGMGVKSSVCICLWNSAVCSCELLHFGTTGWAWPNRSKIVTHGSSSSGYEFGFNGTPVSEKSPFSLEWGWCCLQHPQAGQQNLILLRLHWFQKKITVVQCFCLCSFTVCGLGCSAPALPRDVPLVSPAWSRVVFCLKLFVFLIGLRFWCGNTSQLWKIPWLFFSLHNPSQPGM